MKTGEKKSKRGVQPSQPAQVKEGSAKAIKVAQSHAKVMARHSETFKKLAK